MAKGKSWGPVERPKNAKNKICIPRPGEKKIGTGMKKRGSVKCHILGDHQLGEEKLMKRTLRRKRVKQIERRSNHSDGEERT